LSLISFGTPTSIAILFSLFYEVGCALVPRRSRQPSHEE
jgi:hypothetical protein